MVPAKPRDTIAQFLAEVERVYHQKHLVSIKCTQVLVEDSYEIDERYSVEECLGDMFPVTVVASIIEVKVKQQANLNQKPIK
jgi:hypothetical protein